MEDQILRFGTKAFNKENVLSLGILCVKSQDNTQNCVSSMSLFMYTCSSESDKIHIEIIANTATEDSVKREK